jgi:hypothetical protein
MFKKSKICFQKCLGIEEAYNGTSQKVAEIYLNMA